MVVPGGETVELTSDGTRSTTATSLAVEHDARARDTGLPVRLSTTSDSCSLDDPQFIFLTGQIGDVCRIRIQVDGADGFRPFDHTLSIRFEPSKHVSWKVVAEPTSPGCYTPGAPLDPLVVEASGTTGAIYDVGVLESTPGLTWSADHSDDGRILTVQMTIGLDAAVGTERIRIAFSALGQYLSTSDEPTVRDYAVQASC